MIVAIWSNDPEVYDVLLGGHETVNKIFVKINYSDYMKIVTRFGLTSLTKDTFVRSDNYKYVCIKTDKDEKAAVEMVNAIRSSMT
jgi:hypothetical protein